MPIVPIMIIIAIAVVASVKGPVPVFWPTVISSVMMFMLLDFTSRSGEQRGDTQQ